MKHTKTDILDILDALDAQDAQGTQNAPAAGTHAPTPPRAALPVPELHVLLARESTVAIVLRSDPLNGTAVIGWDRMTDTFRIGQWLKGRICPLRSDIAPNGAHWIYRARKGAKTYTVVARTPYLKALDFYPMPGTRDGGGLFLDSTEYCLNDRDFAGARLRQESALFFSPALPDFCDPAAERDEFRLYFPRLRRDGWRRTYVENAPKGDFTNVLTKHIGDGWQLVKLHTIRADASAAPRVTHSLFNDRSGREIVRNSWTWADWDGARLLWTAAGKLTTATLTPDGLTEPRVLLDTTPMTFRPIRAPY